MTGQPLSYLVPFLVSLTIAVSMGLYTWRHRAVSGATPWTVVALSEALWILGYIFELLSPGLDGKIFWDNVQFLGMFVVPTALLAFALDYTGRKLPRSKQTWVVLTIAPILLMCLVFTDDWHHLIRPDARLVTLRGEPFAALTYSFTTTFWLLSLYSYALIFAGLAILIDRFIRPQQLYRGQVGVVLLGMLIPILGWLFTLAGITPYFYRDTTPFAFALSNLVLVWGLFRYQLFDIVPIARDTLVENMRDAVIVLDVQGRVVDLNPVTQRLIGRPLSQVIGQRAGLVFANWPDLVEKYRDVQEARSEMTVQVGEKRYHVEMNLTPLYDRRGALKGRLVVARDITERQQAQDALQRAHDELERRVQERTAELTAANEQLQREIAERKQAEEALQENEQRFRTIFDSVNDAIFVHDLTSGDILDVNQTMCEMYGYTREEARQASVEDLSAGEPPYTQQEALAWIKKATAGAPQLFEWRARRKNGRLFWVEVNMRRAVIGGQDRLLVVVRDVTERKRAEEALRESEAVYYSLVETLPMSVCRKDLAGRFTFGNRQFCDGLKRPQAEIVGKTDFDLHPAELALKYRRDDQWVIETGQVLEIVEEHGGMEGHRNYVQVFKSPLRDAEGKIAGVQIMFWDVSERKRAEREREILQHLALELTAPLTLQELVKLLAAHCQQLFWYDSFRFDLYDEQEQLRIPVYAEDTPADGQKPVDVETESEARKPESIRAVFEGKQVLVNRKQGTTSDGLAPWGFPSRRSQSMMFVPVRWQGRCDGVVYVQSYTPERYNDRDLTLLQMVANQCGAALARVQADEALRASQERYRAFIAQSTEGIWRFDHDQPIPTSLPQDEQIEWMFRHSYVAECNDAFARMYGYQRAEDLVGKRLGDIVIRSDPANIEYLRRFVQSGYRIIDAESHEVDARGQLRYFSNNMVGFVEVGQLMRTWGTQRDITERKQAEAADQRRVALLTTLNQTALDLSAQLDLQTLLPAIMERAIHLIDAPMGTLMLLRPAERGETLEQVYSYNLPPGDNVYQLRLGEGLSGRVAQTGEPLVVEDYSQWPGRDLRLEGAPYHAMLAVPIKWQGKVLGTVGVIDTRPARFGPEDVEIVGLLAAQAAVAIQNARLYTTLQESEQTLRALLNATSDEAFLLDTTGVLLALNDALARSMDKSVEELLGARVYDLLPPDLAQARQARIEQVIGSGNPLRFEDIGANRGWYDNSIYPVFDAHGHVARVAIFARDITERKRAEEQIRKLNRTLQMINEVNQTLVRATEEADLLQRVCQIIVELGGYRLAWVGWAEQDEAKSVRPTAWAGHDAGYLDTVNITWADTERGCDPTGTAIRTGQPVLASNILTDPAYAPWREQAIQRGYASSMALPLLSYGQAFGALQIYAAEPEAFDAEEVNLLTEMAGDLAYGIVALRTRAEHQRAEEQIKRLNQDLERRARGLAALNQASQIMASTLDLDTLLKLVIEQIGRLLEVGAASVLLCPPAPHETGITGGDCSELVFAAVTGPGAERLKDMRLPITAGIAGWVVRERRGALVADAQGDPRFYPLMDTVTGITTHSVLAVPLIAKGAALGVIEVVSGIAGAFDEHDRQVLEALSGSAAIALENARLYATEQQRAAALARALEQQRRLDQLQREFIQNVSHELRTPLTLIRGHAEVLESGEMGALQPEQQNSISVISRRAQMLSKMVNDIVNILEIEQHELIREPVDLEALARACLAEFRAAAEKADVVPSLKVAPGAPPVFGDPLALRRMLDNLVGNALKFTAAGGSVTVRLLPSEEGVTLQVADTGIGIPSDQLDRIFDRFYQVDGSATRRYGGMGLGLALVKQIVEAHGGQITVTSEIGAGTTFTIWLPKV